VDTGLDRPWERVVLPKGVVGKRNGRHARSIRPADNGVKNLDSRSRGWRGMEAAIGSPREEEREEEDPCFLSLCARNAPQNWGAPSGHRRERTQCPRGSWVRAPGPGWGALRPHML
jgi:hypothetical protein